MKDSRLLLKSLAGMIFLLLAMGLAIFLPYGSLSYPLAWLYLAVFFTPVVGITIYLFAFDKHLLKGRVVAGPLAEPTVRQKAIQSVAGLLFLGIYVVSAFDFKFHRVVRRCPSPDVYGGAYANAFYADCAGIVLGADPVHDVGRNDQLPGYR
jgi:hypothetical protein